MRSFYCKIRYFLIESFQLELLLNGTLLYSFHNMSSDEFPFNMARKPKKVYKK